MRTQRLRVGTATLRRSDGTQADLDYEVLLKFRAATAVLHVFVNGKPVGLFRAKLREGGNVAFEADLAPERDWPEGLWPQFSGWSPDPSGD